MSQQSQNPPPIAPEPPPNRPPKKMVDVLRILAYVGALIRMAFEGLHELIRHF